MVPLVDGRGTKAGTATGADPPDPWLGVAGNFFLIDTKMKTI